MVKERILILVCGQARCGSSLTMQMLHAGGVPTTGEHPAFEVPQTAPSGIDLDWIARQHAAVKLLDPHRVAVGWTAPRIVIWLDRDPREQAKSMMKFLAVFGVATSRQDEGKIRRSLINERSDAMNAAGVSAHPSHSINFEDLIESPNREAIRLAHFLDPYYWLDTTMATSVVRHRPPTCLPYLLEAEMLGGRA